METPLPVSPTRPPFQDDDEGYNTEGARIFFGPLKTPERRLSTMQDIIPSSPLPHSPPIPQPDLGSVEPSSTSAEEDLEALLVEELVQEGEDIEDDDADSGGGDAKDNADYFPDEPSFVLAERISRATDNPSPPPSMLAPADIFGDLAFLTLHSEEKELPPTAADLATVPPPIQLSASPPLLPVDAMDLDAIPASIDASLQPDSESSAQSVSLSEKLSTPDHNPTDSSMSATDNTLVSNVSAGPTSDVVGSVIESAPSEVQVTDGAASNNTPARKDEIQPSVEHLTPPLDLSTPPLRRSRRSVNPTPSQPPQLVAATLTPNQLSPRQPRPRRNRLAQTEVIEDSQEEDTDDSATQNGLTPLAATPRGKERSRSKSPLIFNRQVGSLSPKTSDLLSQLIPTFTDPTPLQLDSVSTVPSPLDSNALTPRLPVFFPPPENAPSTPKRTARPLLAASPPKPLLSESQPGNIPPTPARRITMEEAIEKGHLSPVKAVQMGYTPRAAASGSILPSTPARRVLVTDKAAPVSSSSRPTLRFGSPVRARSRAPEEAQVEDIPMADAHASSSSKPLAPPIGASASQTADKSNATARVPRLPFPITTSKPPSVPKAASAGAKSNEEPRNTSTVQSPAKSNLKQATSRIPRIGTKPYARPPAAVKPVVTKPPSADRPVIIRKVDLSKPSTTKMVIAGSSAVSNESAAKGKGKATATVTRPLPTTTAKPAVLKRKRGAEPLSSPVKQRPIRLVSSVVAPTASSAIRAASTTPASKVTVSKAPKAAGSSITRRAREPPSRTAAIAAAAASTNPSPELAPIENPRPESAVNDVGEDAITPVPESLGSLMQQGTEPLVDVISATPEDPPPNQQQQHFSLPVIRIDSPHDTPPIETLPPFIPVEVPPPGVRRTGRVRKSTQQQTNDVLAESSTTNKPNSRRKAASQNFRFTFTDAYSEMSTTALKNLTAANTVKNQAYLSIKLETEIVRKDGARPESPAVKIKTVAQREQEEKQRRRLERAQRYARRSGGEVPGSSDLEPDSEDDVLPGGSDDSSAANRHQRGAGEDEDYETPHRAFKRMKLTEDGAEEAEEEEEENRRVKWDHGLFTVVFLDEVKLGSRPYSKAKPPLKGCLAPTAKGLPLDTLGNLPEAHAPMIPLAPENVVVKKFIYDTDIVEPEPEKLPPVKALRTRSKKAKT